MKDGAQLRKVTVDKSKVAPADDGDNTYKTKLNSLNKVVRKTKDTNTQDYENAVNKTVQAWREQVSKTDEKAQAPPTQENAEAPPTQESASDAQETDKIKETEVEKEEEKRKEIIAVINRNPLFIFKEAFESFSEYHSKRLESVLRGRLQRVFRGGEQADAWYNTFLVDFERVVALETLVEIVAFLCATKAV